MVKCKRILFGVLLCCGLASAEPLIVPIDQLFKNIPAFDALDAVIVSTGGAFADVSPLDLTGQGTDTWTSQVITDGHAIANGPELSGLSSMTLDMASKDLPVKVVVRVRYHGVELRAMLLIYDGTTWSLSTLPSGVPQVVLGTTDGSTPGDGGLGTPGFTGPPSGPNPSGSNPSGPNPSGPTDSASVPEPSLTSVAGLALLALVLGARRRQTAAPQA